MASADNYAMTRESLREELMANASILTMFTNSFFKTILSPVILLFISYLFFKKRKKIPISAIDVITLCGFIILLFVGSRTVMLNAFILSAFFYYSCYRDKITIKRLLSFGTVILLIIILVFPAVNLYRSSRMKVHAQYQGNLSFLNSMKEVFGLTASSYSLDMDDNNINARSVNVLQVFILSFDNDYIGDGELSKAAISFSLPKILFPNKSYKGSQILIEEELGVYTDIADSYLLFAKMDYGFIGFFVCILLFLMLLSIWDIYMKGTLLIFNDIYLKSYFIVMAINLCYYVEKSVDEILPQLLYSILYLLLYYGAIKLYKAIM
jgi:hypothetical protein